MVKCHGNKTVKCRTSANINVLTYVRPSQQSRATLRGKKKQLQGNICKEILVLTSFLLPPMMWNWLTKNADLSNTDGVAINDKQSLCFR